jgi:hypothetical protein
LDGIDRQHPDRIDGELLEFAFGGDGHDLPPWCPGERLIASTAESKRAPCISNN